MKKKKKKTIEEKETEYLEWISLNYSELVDNFISMYKDHFNKFCENEWYQENEENL